MKPARAPLSRNPERTPLPDTGEPSSAACCSFLASSGSGSGSEVSQDVRQEITHVRSRAPLQRRPFPCQAESAGGDPSRPNGPTPLCTPGYRGDDDNRVDHPSWSKGKQGMHALGMRWGRWGREGCRWGNLGSSSSGADRLAGWLRSKLRTERESLRANSAQ